MNLDLSGLENAVSALGRSMKTWETLCQGDTISNDDKETIKSGVIQCFEVAYEQCWKFMRRWLKENISPGVADGIPRRELFRLAARQLLIDDVDDWMMFHEARNLTSHTYDRDNADQAFEYAFKFLPQALKLLNRLKASNE